MRYAYDCVSLPDRGMIGQPTPRDVYLNRRTFVKAIAASGSAATAMAACSRADESKGAAPGSEIDPRIVPPIRRPEIFPAARNETFAIPDAIADQRLTDRLTAASHNNYYEFLPGKGGDVWPLTKDFAVEPWTVEVTGECHKPRKFDLDDLFKFDHEERLYHFRCVERWAMNVPWVGFPLRQLLESVQPKDSARFIRFETVKRPDQMPGIAQAHWYPWPYHEGLRMDEAMHELTFVATGMYGAPLPKQNGAPVRIVVPWKYGYKSPKSVVRMELVREQPRIFWQIQAHEYGFLSNVNPNIPHPRWSQAQSHWLDRPQERFPTPIFNGYGAQVAHLYPDEPREPQQPLRPGQEAR